MFITFHRGSIFRGLVAKSDAFDLLQLLFRGVVILDLITYFIFIN